ncbi:hypothetical protein PYW07_005056 [Mythimna separata]|uniref:Uncharacterized protein n=1 Tax=Mythimna separata TaxID=271217 RepID=A0AAD7YDP0_MYTSE|nr:hypothetical protein PYW07_005056 [Mythimna separata]
MKLSFVTIFVFLLATVAGNLPSPARRGSHGAQRFNVAKPTVGHSSGRSRVKTHLNGGFLTSAAKPANPIRGDVGKTQQDTLTPKRKTLSGKSSNSKSNKTGRQNVVQATRSPKANPPIRKSGNAKSGTNGQTIQRQKPKVQYTTTPKSNPATGKSNNTKSGQNLVQPTRSPNKKPPNEKSGNAKSDTDGQTIQQLQKRKVQYTTTPKSNPSTGKSDNTKSGKELQQRKTTTLKPPKAGISGNSPFAKDSKTQHQQDTTENTPTPKPGNAENSNGGKDGQTKQQQNEVTNYTLTSTFKPPTAEKLQNLSSIRDGQLQQNVTQHTSTLKPSTEKFSSSSSDKRESHLQHNNFSSRTDFHHNYDYRPPQHISYGSQVLPVYHGSPPVYVYEYRDSGSRFDNLLTGLALYNLGRNSQMHHYDSDRRYSSSSGEICKLGISKRTGEYEETRIDCNLMSSFIWEDAASAARTGQHVVKNSTEVTVTRVSGAGNSSVTSMTVTSHGSHTVEDALQVKGPSIAVTPGMTCFMIRTFRDSTALRKPVDCGLLQEYARSSLFRSNAQCLLPFMSTTFNFLIIFMVLGKYCE